MSVFYVKSIAISHTDLRFLSLAFCSQIIICRDPDLVKRIGAATALEVRATGIPYTFAPCVAVCRDPRWGRCYESYSEDHKVVQAMTQIILGLQGDIPANYTKGFPYVAGK
ncbi:hypothetical protein BHE74_00019080 [Ensete ventricosum]|uniref:Glycoside hydrolase family 3 N-terminal domain-containing protein n=1 Tax=Ensete ventricosum TaxID=4639 RepID=A0A426Y985_ENSVE|nr:hypothetical protein B296_00053196 [Ensete ventricosum]RWW11953.1 hypothetical protein GW17_00024404 [Ensete ventricosum]RWW73065.1 hypothetical protein BHE74_00019080 [Ensete ventricosum]RZR77711.1 hypothetical protein BHM03_00002823 [Ensete ventricosum]